jgi:hypothetical protein
MSCDAKTSPESVRLGPPLKALAIASNVLLPSPSQRIGNLRRKQVIDYHHHVIAFKLAAVLRRMNSARKPLPISVLHGLVYQLLYIIVSMLCIYYELWDSS